MEQWKNERHNLMSRLLDAVKQCQIRFGGKTELATESDSRVCCLCATWEAVLQHGLKHTNKALSTLKQVTEITGLTRIGSGISLLDDLKKMETEPVFWPYVKDHLSKHELQRYLMLKHVTTDAGRGRAWLRSAFNEHSLERYMHMIMGNTQLSQYYEEEAFLRDQESASVLPNMAAGLGSILFAITIDNAELNTIKPAQGLDLLLPSTPPVQTSYMPRKDEEPRPVIAGDGSPPVERRKERRKKKKMVNIVSFDEDDNTSSPASSVTSPRSISSGIDFSMETPHVLASVSNKITSHHSETVAEDFTNEVKHPNVKTAFLSGFLSGTAAVGQDVEDRHGFSSVEGSTVKNNTSSETGSSLPPEQHSVAPVKNSSSQNVPSSTESMSDTLEQLEESFLSSDKNNTILTRDMNKALVDEVTSSQPELLIKSENSHLSESETVSEIVLEKTQSNAESLTKAQQLEKQPKDNHSGSITKTHLLEIKTNVNTDSESVTESQQLEEQQSDGQDESKTETPLENLSNNSITEGLRRTAVVENTPKCDDVVNETKTEHPPTDSQLNSLSETQPHNDTTSKTEASEVLLHQDQLSKKTVTNTDIKRNLQSVRSYSLDEMRNVMQSNESVVQKSDSTHSRHPPFPTKCHSFEENTRVKTSEEKPPLTSSPSQTSSVSLLSETSDSSYLGAGYGTPATLTPLSPEGKVMEDDIMLAVGSEDTASGSYDGSADLPCYNDDTESAALALAVAQKGYATSQYLRTQGDGSHAPEYYSSTHDSISAKELKEALIAMMMRKDEVEDQNMSLRALLESEIETSTALRLEMEEMKKNHLASKERDAGRLRTVSRENDLLKHQLKKYVNAVQMLRRQGAQDSEFHGIHLDGLQPAIPQSSTNIDYSFEASEYEKKLIQVAEMHGELIEFNEILQKQLVAKEIKLKLLKQELIDLRGPLPQHLQFSEDNLSIDSAQESLSSARPLINIWIPCAFLKGIGSDAFHVYQVYIRIKDEEWNVYRRYTQFHEFHKKLKKKYPLVSTYNFPKKKAIGNKEPRFVEQRRRLLQVYLRQAIDQPLQNIADLTNSPSKQKLIEHLPFFGDIVKANKKDKSKVRKSTSGGRVSAPSPSHNTPDQYTGL